MRNTGGKFMMNLEIKRKKNVLFLVISPKVLVSVCRQTFFFI